MKELGVVLIVLSLTATLHGQIELTPSSPICETIRENALLFGGSNCFINNNPSGLGRKTIKEHELIRAAVEATGLPVGYPHQKDFFEIRDSFRDFSILEKTSVWEPVTGTPQIGDVLVGRRHMSIVVQLGRNPSYFYEGSKVKKSKQPQIWKDMKEAVGTSYLVPCTDNTTLTDWLTPVGDDLFYPPAGCKQWDFKPIPDLPVFSQDTQFWKIFRPQRGKRYGFAHPYRRSYLMLFRYIGPEYFWHCGDLGMFGVPPDPAFPDIPPDCPNVDPYYAEMIGFWNLDDPNELIYDVFDPYVKYLPTMYLPEYHTHIFVPGYFDFKINYQNWWGNLLKHTMVANQWTAYDNFLEFHVFNSMWVYYDPLDANAVLTYPNAIANARVLYNILSFIVDSAPGQDWSTFFLHCYGLGAVTCGMVGNEAGGRLGAIYAYNPRTDMSANLDPEIYGLTEKSAKFVSVIHTSSAYSDMSKMGHIDWYPNMGGTQPVCALLPNDDPDECDAEAAPWYMIAGAQSENDLDYSCLAVDQTCPDETLTGCTAVDVTPDPTFFPCISPSLALNGYYWPEYYGYLELTTTDDNMTYFCDDWLPP